MILQHGLSPQCSIILWFLTMSEAPGTRDCVRQRTSSSDETVPVKRPRTEETEESSKLEDDEVSDFRR